MTNFGTVYSLNEPDEIKVLTDSVFIASSIEEYTETVDETELSGYKYTLIKYTKDEYIKILGDTNAQLEEELLDTQSALCDIYEIIIGEDE